MIDRYITEQIKKRGITLYDMVGEEYINPSPEKRDKPAHEVARWNKFKSLCGDYRFCELLTEGDFDQDLPYNNLSIPVKDLVRYWWDNFADREAVLGIVFDHLLTVYKDRMLPERPEEEPVDLSDAFDGIGEKGFAKISLR